MRTVFLPLAWEQYLWWLEKDRSQLKRINRILVECTRAPYSGLGKPEPLKNQLSGWWSRRIDEEHRLIYRVDGDDLIIAQCRFHYHK